MNNLKTQIFFLFLLFFSAQVSATTIQEFSAAHPIKAQYSNLKTDGVKHSDCPKRKKYCKGTRSWQDGSVYEGEFRFGEPHGTGTYTWNDGSHYTGHFLDGYRHGKGKQILDNGDVYNGEWQLGLMHGRGEYNWTDGSKYIGEFYEGLMNGKGTIYLANGEMYDGEWKNGLAHGDGTFTRIDGSKYTGKNKQGQRHGKGVITWRTGDVFIGSWKNGRVNKTGIFQYNNGDKYICVWEEGEITGEANYIFVNGREIKGDLMTIEREVGQDPEQLEGIMSNLGLTWYAIGMEYKAIKRYDLAALNLRYAQKYVTPSSDLNKLIHQQLIIIDEAKEKEGL